MAHKWIQFCLRGRRTLILYPFGQNARNSLNFGFLEYKYLPIIK